MRKSKLRCRVPLLALLLLGAAINAQAAESLFDGIGGEKALHQVVDELVEIMLDDDRINFAFAEADMSKFTALLYAQLCELTGGPCVYEGRDMRTSHEKLKVTNAQFNALAEDLYLAFDRVGGAVSGAEQSHGAACAPCSAMSSGDHQCVRLAGSAF